MQPEPSDESLIERCAGGDERSFAELVRRYQRRVVGFLVQIVGDRELARDLSQEVFVRVWSAADSFNPRYRFTTWLFRIAHNLAIDHLRRRRLQTTPLETETADGETYDRQVASTAKDPLDVLENRQLGNEIHAVIASLSGDARELVLLRHFALLSYQEIAELKAMPLGTVKNKLFRAHSVLRDALAVHRRGRKPS